MKSALIVWGGWEGHEPRKVAELFAGMLRGEGFEVELSESLDSFQDEERLGRLDLIVPVWSMGKISDDQLKSVVAAVAEGVGIAGCHGGMCDAFREACEWQFMTGGQCSPRPTSPRRGAPLPERPRLDARRLDQVLGKGPRVLQLARPPRGRLRRARRADDDGSRTRLGRSARMRKTRL